ncbi:UROD/MetE-like protein [Microthyrium microscopicum]|uniref:UROD/MetE-like protein n=1 Tax=Microthyrium microscopicum TaxID=703497 RepID=A0A6A6ULV4_9PEZI|nr:UROD/MetE-like protein [Microthyrium microscopicum]
MPLPPGVFRADHVGSLLRPAAIKSARLSVASQKLDAAGLRKVEDDEIAAIVAKQLENGLKSITDGEFRRAYFHLDFLQQLGGVEMQGMIKSSSIGPEGWSPPRLAVTGKLTHEKDVQVDDYKYLQGEIDRHPEKNGVMAKVCVPSPTMVHFRGGRASIDVSAYPSLDAFFEDLAHVYQQELDSLYKAGVRFVQLDDTNLAYLCDETMRAEAKGRGDDPDLLPLRYAELINAAISKRPKDLVVGIHLCRGNYRSKHFASGSYEPVAQVLFQNLDVDVYFLEYDDARSGDFSPLRFLPPGKIVVLGVMSSKKAELDDKETIIKRLHEAAEFCPEGLEQLCLSHQCGFSSTQEGNDLSEEQQWAKVRLEVEIAKEVWGDA